MLRRPLNFFSPHRIVAKVTNINNHFTHANLSQHNRLFSLNINSIYTVFQQDFDKLYTQLNTSITPKWEAAQSNDKKFLLVIGEDPFGKKSLLATLMTIMYMMRTYHVMNVMTQTDVCSTIPSHTHSNLHFLFHMINHYKMNITPANIDHKLNENINIRHINNLLYHLNEHCILIVDAKYLNLFFNNNSTYDMVSLNATNIRKEVIHSTLSLEEAILLTSINTASSHIQANIASNNVDDLSIAQLIKLCDHFYANREPIERLQMSISVGK